MEGNKMSTEEVVTVGHQEGPPWKTVGRFPTFDEADQKRLELSTEENLQVKVRWGRLRDNFVVKARIDPAFTAAEDQITKRDEKKRRKAKLNKKRRKK
jgi:hypothetical protein